MNLIQIIAKAAKVAKISPQILVALCTYESNLKTVVVPNDGGSPTYGICQVKFETAKMLGFKGEAIDLLHPETNAKYAARYLKYQHDRYDGDWCKTVSAYNSGSYSESKINPGYPKNLVYVNRVKSKLEKDYQHHLTCDSIRYENELVVLNVSEDNGTGRRTQSAK